jgi:hypothetical protein
MLVCPPNQRKQLTIVVGDGRDENAAKAHALDRHLRGCPQDPKGVEGYDWTVIITACRARPGSGSGRLDLMHCSPAGLLASVGRRAGASGYAARQEGPAVTDAERDALAEGKH